MRLEPYIIIERETYDALCADVKRAILLGYEPVGGFCCREVRKHELYSFYYIQAMKLENLNQWVAQNS